MCFYSLLAQGSTSKTVQDLTNQIEDLKRQLSGSINQVGSASQDTSSKVKGMETALEELQVRKNKKTSSSF